MNFLECVVINPVIPMKKGQLYPFIEMGNVSSTYRSPDKVETKPFDSGVRFQDGDTVIARITPCLQNGKRFFCQDIDTGFGSTAYLVFRPKDKLLDCMYLYYFMQTAYIRKSMISSMTGATGRQRVNNDVFRDITVDFPGINVQQRIGGVLSACDALIENNQKQIKLLEEAAQRLYKEWFVDLRFPGYETARFVDGVPEGWDYKETANFGEVITGKTPSTSNANYYSGEIPFVKIPDMHGVVFPIVTESTLTEEGANSQKSKYIPKNSIMVSCIATVGLVNISVCICQTNQQINTIIPYDAKNLYYLYFSMKRLKALLDGVGSNGATMTNVNKTKFEKINVLYPTRELVEKYQLFCVPIFDEILKLSRQIIAASEARDRLLPNLMGGELQV